MALCTLNRQVRWRLALLGRLRLASRNPDDKPCQICLGRGFRFNSQASELPTRISAINVGHQREWVVSLAAKLNLKEWLSFGKRVFTQSVPGRGKAIDKRLLHDGHSLWRWAANLAVLASTKIRIRSSFADWVFRRDGGGIESEGMAMATRVVNFQS